MTIVKNDYDQSFPKEPHAKRLYSKFLASDFFTPRGYTQNS
jgi:hypothetical protein